MRKIISAALALCLTTALCTPAIAAASPTFPDVAPDQWYYSWVEKAHNLGIISGYPDGTFGPEDHVTYGQFAALMVNALYKDEGAKQPAGGPWWEPAARVMNNHGLWIDTAMYDSANWATVADTDISREQMAQVMYNVLRYTDKRASLSATVEAQASIKDFDDIDTQNCYAVANCYAIGLISGIGDGNFAPKGSMTRAQAAVVTCKMYAIMTDDPTGSGAVKPVEPVEPTNPDPVEDPKPSAPRPADAVGGQYNTAVYDVPADTNKDGWITEAEVQAVLDQLRIDYPEGSPWGSKDFWRSPVMGNGSECAGFAYMISDKIFGNLPRHAISMEETHVGDVLINGPAHHTNVVLNDYGKAMFEGVNYDDGYFTANGNSNGCVSWDSVRYYEDWPTGTAGTYIWSRYPKE